MRTGHWLRDDAIEKRLASGNLVIADVFVWLVRLVNAAGSDHNGWDARLRKHAGFGGEADCTGA